MEIEVFNKEKEKDGSASLTPYVAVLIEPVDPEKSAIKVQEILIIVNSISFVIESNNIVDAEDFCYKSFSSLNIDNITYIGNMQAYLDFPPALHLQE